MKNRSSPPNTIRLNKIKHFVNFSESGDIFALPAAYIMKASSENIAQVFRFPTILCSSIVRGYHKLILIF